MLKFSQARSGPINLRALGRMVYQRMDFRQPISLVDGSLAKDKRGKRTLFAAGLFVLTLLVAMPESVLAQKKDRGPARVVVGNVIKTKRSSLQSFVGTLQATRRATVGSGVDGRVIEVEFDAGDPVGADAITVVNESEEEPKQPFVGQRLVQLRTDTLDIEIRAAEIQTQLAQLALDEMKLSMPQQMELSKANLSSAESQMEYSKTNYQRSRALQKQSGAISKLELEAARSEYLANQQAVIGARSEVNGLLSTGDLQLAQAKSRVDSARQETLRLRDLKNQYTIRAPFAGVVTAKLTEVGQWVTRGAPIVEIVQLDPIEMVVNVPQEFSGRVQGSLAEAKENNRPLPVNVTITGVDGSLKGEVVRIIPQADLRSRSFPVRIRIQNPKSGDTFLLQPGMLGRASLNVGRETEMILVSKDALVMGRGETRIFKAVQRAGKTVVQPATVQTGTDVGGWVQVTGDITEKDNVVIIGNERLKANDEILITETRVEKIEGE